MRTVAFFLLLLFPVIALAQETCTEALPLDSALPLNSVEGDDFDISVHAHENSFSIATNANTFENLDFETFSIAVNDQDVTRLLFSTPYTYAAEGDGVDFSFPIDPQLLVGAKLTVSALTNEAIPVNSDVLFTPQTGKACLTCKSNGEYKKGTWPSDTKTKEIICGNGWLAKPGTKGKPLSQGEKNRKAECAKEILKGFGLKAKDLCKGVCEDSDKECKPLGLYNPSKDGVKFTAEWQYDNPQPDGDNPPESSRYKYKAKIVISSDERQNPGKNAIKPRFKASACECLVQGMGWEIK
jgi:hypothetical protein